MTAHVHKNITVAGQYKPRSSVKQTVLSSGATVQCKAELDQHQVLAMLSERTAEANRRLGLRAGAMLSFVKHKKFESAKFIEALSRTRQRKAGASTRFEMVDDEYKDGLKSDC